MLYIYIIFVNSNYITLILNQMYEAASHTLHTYIQKNTQQLFSAGVFLPN